ncbi:MAG: serine/threonine-protein kinase [Phycisphaerales bacterium]|nr:serine/threonine-protein kinase [Phycisphaerales bacterium]
MSDRWNRILQIALEASRLDAEHHEATIRDACGADTALMEEVRSLLAADPPGDEVFAGPIAAKLDEVLDDQLNQIPGRIGPYELDRLIAHGGHGVVYKAHRADEAFERHVAIKLLPSAELSRKGALRFAHERRLLATLDHPNIARLIDGGTTVTGCPFMVMEFVDGRPITEYAGAHKLSIRERLRLFLQVCLAVQYAHQRLVVHRDLKPPNILVTENGDVRLLDFGVAKFLDDHAQKIAQCTATGRFSFTLQYASPEQITNRDVTTLSDVYSLGLVLYELLAGRLPYRVESGLRETIVSICERAPTRPSTICRGINAELDAIVFRALAKDPVHRYPTVESFATDIERFLNGDTVHAHPPARTYRFLKFIKRHRWSALSVCVVFVLVSTFGAMAWHQAVKAGAAAECAENERQKVNQVNHLLGEILTSVEPRGRDVTVRELLDDAVRYARNEVDDSEVKADLLTMVTKAYWSLGLYEKAEKLAVEALILSRRDLGDEHFRTLNLTTGLAGLYAKQGRYQESVELIREAIDVKRRVLGDEHIHTLRDLRTLAAIYLNCHVEKAVAAASEALEAQRRTLGMDHKDTLHTMETLAVAYKYLGRLGESEQLLTEVVRRSKQTLGISKVATLRAMNELAWVYWAQRRLSEAERLCAETVKIQECALGKKHKLTLDAKDMLAGLCIEVGRYKKAEQLLRENLDVYQQTRGDEFTKATETSRLLGWLYYVVGRYNEAESLLSNGLDACISLNGSEHTIVVMLRIRLVLVLIKQGRFEEAERQITLAMKNRKRRLGANHPHTLSTRSIRAAIYVREGRLADAVCHCEEVLDAQRRRLGHGHPDVLETMVTLAQAYRRQIRLDEAEQLLTDVLEARRPKRGSLYLLTLESMHTLGNVYLDQQRYTLAESMYQKAVCGRRRVLGADHPDTIVSMMALTRVYYAGGRLEKARELCQELLDLGAPLSSENVDFDCFWDELAVVLSTNRVSDGGGKSAE